MGFLTKRKACASNSDAVVSFADTYNIKYNPSEIVDVAKKQLGLWRCLFLIFLSLDDAFCCVQSSATIVELACGPQERANIAKHSRNMEIQ